MEDDTEANKKKHQPYRNGKESKTVAFLKRCLEVGDLVLRRVLSREGLHKLFSMWEGPFRISRVSRPSVARLETTGRDPHPERMEHPTPPEVQHMKQSSGL